MFSAMRIQEGFYCMRYKWLKEIHNHFLSGFDQKGIDHNGSRARWPIAGCNTLWVDSGPPVLGWILQGHSFVFIHKKEKGNPIIGMPNRLCGEGDGNHSSTLAWKIPWMEEPGGLQSMGSWRVGHDRGTSVSLFTFMHWRRKWQLTPVFLPGESQGQGSLVGCRLWGHTELDMTEAT